MGTLNDAKCWDENLIIHLLRVYIQIYTPVCPVMLEVCSGEPLLVLLLLVVFCVFHVRLCSVRLHDPSMVDSFVLTVT